MIDRVMLFPGPFREAAGNTGRAGDLACPAPTLERDLQLRDSTGLGAQKCVHRTGIAIKLSHPGEKYPDRVLNW